MILLIDLIQKLIAEVAGLMNQSVFKWDEFNFESKKYTSKGMNIQCFDFSNIRNRNG
ncbi:MAG: hypothetical protein IPL31_02735 [Saprospiraceae bacterium]|nr:hypothetical protein [Saprospiraceae bacterium]